MFSTFQGGPFVEVFTPQVRTRADRHSHLPELSDVVEFEKYPGNGGPTCARREPPCALDRPLEARSIRRGTRSERPWNPRRRDALVCLPAHTARRPPMPRPRSAINTPPADPTSPAP